MKVTPALKEWALKNLSLAKDSSDAVIKSAVGSALAEGKLTAEELMRLQTESPTPGKGDAMSVLKGLIAEAVSPLAAEIKSIKDGAAKPAEGGAKPEEKPAEVKSEDVMSLVAKSVAGGVAEALKGYGMGGARQAAQSMAEDGPTPAKLFTMEGVADEKPSEARVRVKKAAEWYDSSRTAATYPETTKHLGWAGRPVRNGEGGRALDIPSQLDKAISGAFFKFSVNSALKSSGGGVPLQYRMTDHDNALMQYALHEMKWTGLLGYNENSDESKSKLVDTKLSDFQIKALLDDSTSGGLEAAPIVFDDALILTPLLNGELFPLVTLVNIARGRRIEGFSMSNPTITDGYPEGNEVPLFDTSSFIAAFDTSIFDAVGAIELGQNFEEDSPVAIADRILERYGEQYLAYLDKIVAIGNGTTQAEGIFTASGTTSVSSANGGSGPPTLSDYEGLLFGVAKEYKPQSDKDRCIFISNEVTYRRSRGMKVDPASPSTDERRILGMDHERYMTLEHPHKINHNIANTKLAFVNMRYYRMYRRLGMQVRIENGGKELARRNQRMIVVRARFGGQLELGGACSVMTDCQS